LLLIPKLTNSVVQNKKPCPVKACTWVIASIKLVHLVPMKRSIEVENSKRLACVAEIVLETIKSSDR